MAEQNPIWNMIQSILAIKEQNLREQQFGEQKSEFTKRLMMEQNQLDATNRATQTGLMESVLGGVQAGTVDPNAILQSPTALKELSDRTGFTTDFYQTMLPGIAPSVSATKNKVVQGYIQKNGVSPGMAEEAATGALTGESAFQLQQNQFMSDLLTGKGDHQADPGWATLSNFFKTKLATGEGPGDVALNLATAGLSGSELSQAAGVRLGTRMSAQGAAQNELGWATLREEHRKNLVDAAKDELMARIAMAKEKNIYNPENMTAADAALKNMTGIMDNLQKNSSTLMPEMRDLLGRLYDAELNRVNDLLPGLYDSVPYMTTKDANGNMLTPGALRNLTSKPGGGAGVTFGPAIKGQPTSLWDLIHNIKDRGGQDTMPFGSSFNTFDAIKNYVTSPSIR